MLNNALSTEVAESWGRFSQIAALWIPVAWFHFVLIYTGQWQHKMTLLAAYIVTVILFPLSFGNIFIQEFRPAAGMSFYPVPGILYHVFPVFFLIIVVYTHLILYFQWKRSEITRQREEYRLLFLLNLFGFTMGGLSFLPVYGISFYQYNLFLMPLWQIGVIYGFVRFRFMDLEKLAILVHEDRLRAAGTLIASLHHEIRNPLYIVQGTLDAFANQIKEQPRGLEAPLHGAAISTIETATVQMNRINNLMRRYARFIKNVPNLDQGTAELRNAFDNIMPMIQYELSLDDVQIKNEVPEDFPRLPLNGQALEQILFNLLVNGLHALQSQKKSGIISIKANQDNGRLRVHIHDNGPGIPGRALKDIFEPFYTSKHNGMGLGLYITRQLIERSGGKIYVRSNKEHGTTFTLEFKR